MIGKKIEDEKKVRTRWGIFHQLVDLLNKSTITIMVILNYFSKSRVHFKFKYDVIDNKWIDINSIINSVTMNFD